MSKWHFGGNSRIIWLFPPCSEGSHIASSLIQETSPKHVARIGPLGLILCLLLLALVPKVFAAPQTGQIIQDIRSTAIAESLRRPSSPAFTPVQATFMTKPRCNATCGRYGTAAILKMSAWSANRTPKGWIIHIYVAGKADDPDHRIPRAQFGFAKRRSGAL